MYALSRLALALSLGFGPPAATPPAPGDAAATPASTTGEAAAPAPSAQSEATPPATRSPRPRARASGRGRTPWLARCAPGLRPCTRSNAARLTLGFASLAAAAAGTGLLLIVGDRLRAGDPGAMVVGMGALGLAGVASGGLIALGSGDRANHPDRIRPATMGLRSTFAGTNTAGERRPGTMAFNLAPTWYFPDGQGRLRLLGSVDAQLGPRVDVDPRAPSGQSFPTGLQQSAWGIDLAADMAFALPYRARGLAMGGWELRWRPSAHIRRERTDGRAQFEDRRYERTMFLPLTVGARWKLAPRQRFTVYVGPRFDFLAWSVGDEKFERGAPQLGAVYGEAWYDIDVPNLLRGAAAERHSLHGQLSMGYIHTRFDGHGINVGGIKGFIGPAEMVWRMKLRRHGRPTAWLFGAGGRIGNGLSVFAELGIALPDLGADPSRPSLSHRRTP